MNYPCTPEDLREVGNDGYLGLLTVLVDKGWRIYGTRRNGKITLTAEGDNYVVCYSGLTDKEPAVKLFGQLISDEPDALAAGAAFWPPSRPVTYLADRRR